MSNRAGRKWMDAAPVSDHVRTKAAETVMTF
jgi:hypothetical protein